MERLKKLRKYYGFSIDYVAEEIGVSKHTYKAWEHNKNAPPPNMILKLSNVFNLQVIELIEDLPLDSEIAQFTQKIRNEIMREFNIKG